MAIDKDFIKNMKEFPAVIIGDAKFDFEKHYNEMCVGKVIRVTNDAELREAVSYYSGISYLDYPVVIDGIYFVPNANTALLKFLEESPLQIVLLSYMDCFDNIILSRVKSITKYYKRKTSCSFSGKEGYDFEIQKLGDKVSDMNKYRAMSMTEPSLYVSEKEISSKRLREKYESLGGRFYE